MHFFRQSLPHFYLLNVLHHLLQLLRHISSLIFLLFFTTFLFATLLLIALLGIFLSTFSLFLFLNTCASFGMELINHKFDNHILLKEVKRCSFIDSTLNCFLLLCSLDNSLLNCPLCNKLIDIYISTLSNSMCSICCLSIHCWIPVVIVEYYCICCS